MPTSDDRRGTSPPGAASGGSRSLLLRVLGFTTNCRQCDRDQTWVMALRPVHRPGVDELVTCDFPHAIGIARTLLSDAGQIELAAALMPRPPLAKGKSYNANACASCGAHPDWHDFDGLMIEAYHTGFQELAIGRCAIAAWRQAKDLRHYVIPYSSR